MCDSLTKALDINNSLNICLHTQTLQLLSECIPNRPIMKEELGMMVSLEAIINRLVWFANQIVIKIIISLSKRCRSVQQRSLCRNLGGSTQSRKYIMVPLSTETVACVT